MNLIVKNNILNLKFNEIDEDFNLIGYHIENIYHVDDIERQCVRQSGTFDIEILDKKYKCQHIFKMLSYYYDFESGIVEYKEPTTLGTAFIFQENKTLNNVFPISVEFGDALDEFTNIKIKFKYNNLNIQLN